MPVSCCSKRTLNEARIRRERARPLIENHNFWREIFSLFDRSTARQDGLLRYRTKIFNTEYNFLSINFCPAARRSGAPAAKSR
jgi:hypothetical protein